MQQDGSFAAGARPTPPDPATNGTGSRQQERRAAMALLARATQTELRTGLEAAGVPQSFEPLRAPETGLVMVQGR